MQGARLFGATVNNEMFETVQLKFCLWGYFVLLMIFKENKKIQEITVI